MLQAIALHGHTRAVTRVKFNRDGDLLFSCAKDGQGGRGGGGVAIKGHGSVEPTERVLTNEFELWSGLLWIESKTATPTASCNSDSILSEIWNSASGKRHFVVYGASSMGFSWEGRTPHPLP